MALYAFDGTWNKDKTGSDEDTNVVWFRDAYQENKFYWEGVGTRFGILGRIAGGITGAGGKERISEAVKKLRESFKNGDTTIDIVGFSRGAALAVHFANQVAKKLDGFSTPRPIRFLGIWDTVPSFGVPGDDIDLGWDLNLADNVVKCYHAMALDERRHTFPLNRLEARVQDANQEGRLFELWFRGVHSDVGGGNKNNGLSSITLNWMFQNALRAGLRLDPAIVAQNSERRNPDAPISVHEFDPIKNRFRVIRWNDVAHELVAFRGDTRNRKHNNPPANLAKVDDMANPAGAFVRP
jgi:uncharacterized protein (DUF2235 family)